MDESKKVDINDSTPSVHLTVGQLRAVVREEIERAAGQDGHQEPKFIYTTKEAAKIIGVPVSWLAKAARQGDISCVRMGHYVNFTLDDLKSFIEKLKTE